MYCNLTIYFNDVLSSSEGQIIMKEHCEYKLKFKQGCASKIIYKEEMQ